MRVILKSFIQGWASVTGELPPIDVVAAKCADARSQSPIEACIDGIQKGWHWVRESKLKELGYTRVPGMRTRQGRNGDTLVFAKQGDFGKKKPESNGASSEKASTKKQKTADKPSNDKSPPPHVGIAYHADSDKWHVTHGDTKHVETRYDEAARKALALSGEHGVPIVNETPKQEDAPAPQKKTDAPKPPTKAKKATEKKPPAKKAAPSPRPELSESDIVGEMANINPRVKTGDIVLLGKLRERFPDHSKQEFDAAVIKLAERWKVSLHKFDHVGWMTDKEKHDFVQDKSGDWYNVISIRGND